MTNQTIDGVPRELVRENIAYLRGMGGTHDQKSALAAKFELLLLDHAPAKLVEGLEADNVKLAADRAMLSAELETLRKSYRNVLVLLEAAQPQAVPVACVIAFREGVKEPEILSWNQLPVGEHRLYAEPVACAHEWTDDGEFTLTCTKCSRTESHEPYGWVQTRGDAINYFTQEWDVVESWEDQGFEYKAMFDHTEQPAPVVVWAGFKVVEDPTLAPDEIKVCCGSCPGGCVVGAKP